MVHRIGVEANRDGIGRPIDLLEKFSRHIDAKFTFNTFNIRFIFIRIEFTLQSLYPDRLSLT